MEFVVYLGGFIAAWMLGFGARAWVSGRLSPDKGIAFAAAGVAGFFVVARYWPVTGDGDLGAVGEVFDGLCQLAVLGGGFWAGVVSGRR